MAKASQAGAAALSLHTGSCSLEPQGPDEGVSVPIEPGTVPCRSRSSVEERPLHTRNVVGSTPTATTGPPRPDPIAKMLADDRWRMRVESRFWPKVMKPLDWSACWEWQGSKKRADPKQAYGGFKIASYTSVRAHRLSYALYHGVSSGRLCVLHRCDNPPCVNPSHLFLGTVQDNSDDMVAKGRRVGPPDCKGEKNGAAKLNAEQIEVIRKRIWRGETNTAIAADYGVTHQLISRIRRGRSWGEPAMQAKYASLKRGRA